MLDVATLGERAVVTVSLADRESTETVGTLDFALDVFGLKSGDVGNCATNVLLGLSGNEIRGIEGLTVHVDVPVADGVACAGERVPLSVETDGAATVHVFSVDQRGNGYHIWPAGEAGLSRGVVELGKAHLVPVPGGGDERLVAVAIPPSAAVTAAKAWKGFCRLETPFDARHLPQGVAVGTTTYIVRAGGTDGCPEVDTQGADEAIARAPVCR